MGSGLMEPALELAVTIAAEKAAAETKKETLLNSIRNLMETMKCTAQQAMDALEVPADKQEEYRALI